MKGFVFQMSLKCAPKSPIENMPVLVQVMAWRRTGDRSLFEPMEAHNTDTHMWTRGDELT